MNRSRKIIQVLEGFKLGSLGARSKKPIAVVPEPEPMPREQPQTRDKEPQASSINPISPPVKLSSPQPVSMKPMDWLTANPNFSDGTGAFDAVRWAEVCGSSKTRFLLMCKRIGDNYSLEVRAGSNLQVKFSGDRPVGQRQDFVLRGGDFSSSTGEEAAQEFHEIVKKIKVAGSFAEALTSGHLGHGWKTILDVNRQGLHRYVWNTLRLDINLGAFKNIVD
jgi:hypothetical protein